MQFEDELKRFVISCVSSVEELDILALFEQAPEAAWSAQALNQRIRSSERSVEMRLEALCQQGFVFKSKTGDTSSYHLNSEIAVSERRRKLLKAYSEFRVQVIEAIYSAPRNNIEQFAAAFKWRK